MIPRYYQLAAKETAVYPKDVAIPYLALGLANEAGEATGKVKKFLRGDYGQDKLRKALIGELGDVLWYLTMLADQFDIQLDEIMNANIEKLRDRAARGVVKGDGDNR